MLNNNNKKTIEIFFNEKIPVYRYKYRFFTNVDLKRVAFNTGNQWGYVWVFNRAVKISNHLFAIINLNNFML